MIVDDEKLICEWLEFCISANPACTLVGVAHNGREGLELYCREKPELVLTDIKMPVMDGLELLHAIRQQSSGTKVVLLTAFADFEMARNALREGADEYLLKTEMNSEVLQEMLSRMMLYGSNVLVLDQPTNHLDLESIAALNKGLEAVKCNVLVASHDHQLIQTVCNRVFDFSTDGKLTDRRMTYDEYLEKQKEAE